MSAEWLQLGLPVLSLAANVACQWLGLWLQGGQRLLRTVYLGFGAGLLILVCGEALLLSVADPVEVAGYAVTNAVLYGVLGYGYFHFVNLSETGRRVRLMWELAEAPEGLSEQDVLARYGAAEILQVRLGRLLRSRQVELREGRYFIGRPAVLTMARVLMLLKRLLLRSRSL